MPMNAPISREAMQWRIQKSRIAFFGWESVKPSAAFGWAKQVGLKSMPMPFDFAQSIPASLKMKITEGAGSGTTEKWILRKACQDLLPADLVWRQKAQFDEGSGTVDALDQALSLITGEPTVGREAEGRLYDELLRARYRNPDLILRHAGMWTAERVAVPEIGEGAVADAVPAS